MIDDKEILKIAKLSKLEFSEEEFSEIKDSMNKILSHIEILNEVSVDGVEPLYSVNELTDVVREDEVLNTVKKEDFLNNAPEKDDEYIVLPKIV